MGNFLTDTHRSGPNRAQRKGVRRTAMRGIACFGLWALLLTRCVPSPTAEDYLLDASRSRLEIQVFREGVLKFLGHDHRIVAQNLSGTIHLVRDALERSSVQLVVEAASLTVVDPGVDEKERRDVQAMMESARVLDVKRFPTIAFVSTAITDAHSTADGYDLRVIGTLRLHGVEKQIGVPARVVFQADQMRVRGTVDIRQSDFNITPLRIGGGTVKVKDALRIAFDLVAVRSP